MMPGASAWNIVGSRWPPVGVMAWPAGTMRGPSIHPESTARAKATSSNSPPVGMNRPRLRTVVKPARKVVRQLTTARSNRSAGSSCTESNTLAPGPPSTRFTSMSISPGSNVSSGSSISRASRSISPAEVETSVIRSPSTRT